MRLGLLAFSVLGASGMVACLSACAGSPVSTPAGAARDGTSAARNVAGFAYRPLVSSDGVRSVLPAGFAPQLGRPSWMKAPPDGEAAHVAVAQFGATDVLWFPKQNKANGAPVVCEPASSTNGIRADAFGDLWVPDGRADTTTEYAPNCGPALLTIPDPTGEPADVGFDRKGNVYILNLNNHTGSPTVEVYTAAGKHLRALGDASFSVLFGIGTDGNGNVYVSNLTSGNVGNIVEFPDGKMPGTALGLSLGLPGSPVFDHANNLIIADWLAKTIDVFAPPYDAKPATSTLKGSSIWCPLSHDEKRILCGDADFGAIDVYAYPGGAYRYSYTNGLSANALVTGVAPVPAAPF